MTNAFGLKENHTIFYGRLAIMGAATICGLAGQFWPDATWQPMAPVTDNSVRFAVICCVAAYYVVSGILQLYAWFVEGNLIADFGQLDVPAVADGEHAVVVPAVRVDSAWKDRLDPELQIAVKWHGTGGKDGSGPQSREWKGHYSQFLTKDGIVVVSALRGTLETLIEDVPGMEEAAKAVEDGRIEIEQDD